MVHPSPARPSRFDQWSSSVSPDNSSSCAAQDRGELQPATPKWFRIVFEPRVAVRKAPALDAPSVTFLDAGEVIEVSEHREGWVRLSNFEREARGVSDDCDAWVLQDGRYVSLGVLLEPYQPHWFSVVFQPKVAVRKCAFSEAPIVAWLKTGEIIEAGELVGGWVRLSDRERSQRDISDDCGSWVMLDGSSKGISSRLLAASPPPPTHRAVLEEEGC
ncbi:unnamed protein product [Polarella glacialis]|uniref:SH3b domain-containing protein n=1 Tax=Polarella glacialis TaxID=89957 RepID=A0A813GFG7_POLGL|nr:unnamed protein product [Polarella glacialis]